MNFSFRFLTLLPLLFASLLAQPSPVNPPVTQIIAGTNITISPTNGRGAVTINATGGTSGSGTAGQVAFWDGTTSLTGDTDLTFSGSTLTFTNGIAPTSLLVGTSTMPSLNGSASILTTVDTASTLPRGISNVQYSTDANSANFSGYKARGTQTLPIIVAASDVLTNLRAWGYDGSGVSAGYLNMGSLRFRVPSGTTPAATSVPTEAVLSIGSNATPSVLTDTAVFSSTTGVALTALGTNQSITLTPSGTGGVIGPVGAVGTPAFTFLGDTDTGIYRIGANNLGLSVGGSNTADFSLTTGITLTALGTNQSITLVPSGTGSIVGPVGAVGTPSYTFTGDTDTGIYHPAANTVDVSVGGAINSRFVTTHLLLGGLTTDGTGVLQFPVHTTNAGGITLGATQNIWTSAAGVIDMGFSGTSYFGLNGNTNSIVLKPNGTQISFLDNTGITMTNTKFVQWGDTALARITCSTNTTSGVFTFAAPSSGSFSFNKLFTTYNGIATAGNGIVSVQGAGRVTAQTAANASVATYTVSAADASFEVSANVLITTSSAENFTVTCAYTDEGNTARTMTLSFQSLAGAFSTAINFANGAVPYEGVVVHIRCKASTAITIATTGTFTGATYNAEGVIRKLQ